MVRARLFHILSCAGEIKLLYCTLPFMMKIRYSIDAYRTIPEVMMSPFGGILADKFDRKVLMIRLDVLASISVLSYIYAVKARSIQLLYAATVVRSMIAAAYLPVTNSIVPMIVKNEKEDLRRACTINGMIWSGMSLFGGLIAGNATARFGVEVCYGIDCFTYAISAVIMSYVRGNYKTDSAAVKGKDIEVTKASPFPHLRTNIKMMRETFRYLSHSSFGLLVFLKASGCLIWGTSDVLNVSFSHVEGNEAESSKRMGSIYSSVGLGCLIGPILANSTVVDGRRPRTLQLAVVGAMAVMTSGWIGIATNVTSFKAICAFTSVRTVGSAIIWLFSTLLLQNLTEPSQLGRVLGLEFCLSRVSETIIAYIAGHLEDSGHSKREISFLAVGIGCFFFFFWSAYHVFGFGAAQDKFNEDCEDAKTAETSALDYLEFEVEDKMNN